MNLNSLGIFDPNVCQSVGNVIPGTVTGNSDSADYKDTVFGNIADVLNISNCGKVIIHKATVPAAYDKSFTFTKDFVTLPSSSGPFPLNAANTSTQPSTYEKDNVQVDTTSRTVTEDALAAGSGWSLDSITCVDGANNGSPTIDLANRKVTFTIDSASDILECTFTNKATATLTIVKQTLDDTGTFAFTTTGALTPSTFSLTTTATGESGQVQRRFTDILPGDYAVSETALTGWNLNSANCTGDGSDATGRVTTVPSAIHLDPGNNVTCTFVNQPKYGAIDITKLYKHAATGTSNYPMAGATFNVVGPNPSTTSTTTSPTDTHGKICIPGLRFGSYSVSEVPMTGYATLRSQNVTVDTEANCGTLRTSAEALSFTNIPLTDITVSTHSQVVGGTSSTITCVASDDPTSSLGTGTDPKTVPDLTPGTYVCTVVVDP